MPIDGTRRADVPAGRVLTRLLAPFLAAVLALLATGCTGSPSSPSSWRDDSDKAVGQAISGLATARVVARQRAVDGLPHSYAVTTATDALDEVVREVRSFVRKQPPDALHQANADVVKALDDAVEALLGARVLLASPEPSKGQLEALVRRLDDVRDRLDQLSEGLTATPSPSTSPQGSGS